MQSNVTPMDCQNQMVDASPIVKERERRPSGNSPSQSDILILYACIPGYVAYRHREKGTWLVMCIETVFRDHAHELCLVKLLQQVQEQMKEMMSERGCKQMPEIVMRGFCYDLHFKPNFKNTDEDDSDKEN